MNDFLLQVYGAGNKEVNGIYYQTDEVEKGAPVYCRQLKHNSDRAIFIRMSRQGSWWITPNKKEESIFKHYFYAQRSADSDSSSIPPLTGWSPVNQGISPAPRVKKVAVHKDQPFYFDLKKVFLSELFSDVHFHCPDGTVLHAHKIVLSNVSSYFAIVFEGPWDLEHPDGIWKTSNSSETMKAVLSYIYGYPISVEDLEEHSLDILSLAHEYDMVELVTIVEIELIEKISTDNVKDLLHCSARFELERLKACCFDFVKTEGIDLIMDKEFVKISSEDENLWDELRCHMKENQ